ncbi:dienelactone hydrolase family protein [Neobacillus mesonae]|nr:dienelactone hydrolase family protein [Neobacillus mesonae]
MVQILRKRENLIIVIHEVYGINQHIESVCKKLSEQNFDVICPNLLGRETSFKYSQEDVAYRHFMENVGISNAMHKIKNLLTEVKDEYGKIFIIGFSVGATVAWLCSNEECVDGIVGYYGSRIRDYVDLTPQCPTILFFPQEEQSFDVDELISVLETKNVEIHKFNGKHGFCDPYSLQYDEILSQKAFSKMVNFLMSH